MRGWLAKEALRRMSLSERPYFMEDIRIVPEDVQNSAYNTDWFELPHEFHLGICKLLKNLRLSIWDQTTYVALLKNTFMKEGHLVGCACIWCKLSTWYLWRCTEIHHCRDRKLTILREITHLNWAGLSHMVSSKKVWRKGTSCCLHVLSDYVWFHWPCHLIDKDSNNDYSARNV